MKTLYYDFLVVGSGIAGLTGAMHLARRGSVAMVTKKEKAQSCTQYAQGGIACVMREDDSFESHVADTLAAGAGLCDEAVVRRIVSDAPARIAELAAWGVTFEKDLGKEGGHSARRILHAGDFTGRHIEEALLARAVATPNVACMEYAMVIDLITTEHSGIAGENRCLGAYILDQRTGEIFAVCARYTVLATGGCGKVYLYTSNPDVATGDGVAVAWRAGARIKNMEFIQFHPTCLYHPTARRFLISEAVRGEGAELVDRNGTPFMAKYDKRGALAPRDIVARAIDREMKARALECVYLDIRHKGKNFLIERFPNIYQTCLTYGVDMAIDLIPVVPAAHYSCGGLEATVEGATSLPGLLAIGETACTGLHGANRLASNSLLEAIVCSHAMAQYVERHRGDDTFRTASIPPWVYGEAAASDEQVVVAHNWMEVRTCMWDYVGIVRTDKRLERALQRIRNLRHEIRQYYFDYLVTADVLELRNIADVAELIIRSAMLRRESRGLHSTLDCPETATARDTVL
ncbi:MAG: L-aspartate oxidase [Kiritimatiellaeota bacterium]|nr:L-aspartate oxidase [Kiritimatiellota bacterium]